MKSFLIFHTLGFHLALDTSKSHLVQAAILASMSARCKMSIFSNNTAQPAETQDLAQEH